MLDRTVLLKDWMHYYHVYLPAMGYSEVAILTQLNGHVSSLVGRMRAMGHSLGYVYRGYNKRELNRALSLALSCHQQVKGRLTFSSTGGNVKGGGRAWVKDIRL